MSSSISTTAVIHVTSHSSDDVARRWRSGDGLGAVFAISFTGILELVFFLLVVDRSVRNFFGPADIDSLARNLECQSSLDQRHTGNLGAVGCADIWPVLRRGIV